MLRLAPCNQRPMQQPRPVNMLQLRLSSGTPRGKLTSNPLVCLTHALVCSADSIAGRGCFTGCWLCTRAALWLPGLHRHAHVGIACLDVPACRAGLSCTCFQQARCDAALYCHGHSCQQENEEVVADDMYCKRFLQDQRRGLQHTHQAGQARHGRRHSRKGL